MNPDMIIKIIGDVGDAMKAIQIVLNDFKAMRAERDDGDAPEKGQTPPSNIGQDDIIKVLARDMTEGVRAYNTFPGGAERMRVTVEFFGKDGAAKGKEVIE